MLPIALAGCAAPPLAGDDAADPLAVEVAGLAAGAPQSCVATSSTRSLRVIDSRTIAYEIGTTLWVNRLEQSCPGLRPTSTVIVEATGSQYCRGDRVRGLEPGAVIAGPPCVIDRWVPYRRPG